MRKLTVKEFASALNKPFETVKTHIKRGKVQKGSDGLIDIDVDLNKRYISDETNGQGLFSGVVKEPASRVGVKETSPKPEKKAPELTEDERERREMDLRKRRADVELAERAVELKKIELEKKAGNLLPVDLVQNILAINIQAIFKAFEGEMENIASVTCGGNRDILSGVVKQQREMLSRAIEKAKNDAAIDIENAISEYKEVRGVGERM